MKHVWKKVCPVCGTSFETGLKYTRYCPEHRNAKKAGKGRSHVPGVCAQCGRPFYGHGNARFCGDACHDCGRPTADYRCPACWEKFRQRYGVAADEECVEDFLYV